MKKERVVILHNRVAEDAPKDELDVLVQVREIERALAELGFRPRIVPFSLDLERAAQAIREENPLFVFNLVESVEGDGRLVHLAPALLDHLGLPYTGCGQEAVFVTSNKLLGKTFLSQAGVDTPPWLDGPGPPADAGTGAGIYLLKSEWEHASNWLDENSLVRVETEAELRSLLERKNRAGRGRFFAESYVDGREFNLAVLAGEFLPPQEIRFVDFPEGKPHIVDFRAKWEVESFEYIHTQRGFDFPEADGPLLETLRAIAGRCWNRFALAGYARVDFRVDRDHRPWVLEINANPCLSPDGGFAAAAERSGLTFTAMVARIVDDCLAGRWARRP